MKFVTAIVCFIWVVGFPYETVHAATAAKSGLNNKCMDVPNGRIASGTELIMWDCTGAQHQQFDMMASGEIKIGGLCLDAFGGQGRAGDRIGIYTCSGGHNQRWRLDGGALRGINNCCIDIADGTAANGAQLLLRVATEDEIGNGVWL